MELWDKGLIEAAERAQKSPAKEAGRQSMKREDWSSLKTSPSERTPASYHNPLKISVAQVLKIVNGTHRSILSQNVLDHFNEEKPAEGYYTKKTLFQEREELPDDRELLMTAEARGKNAEAWRRRRKIPLSQLC